MLMWNLADTGGHCATHVAVGDLQMTQSAAYVTGQAQ